MGGSPGRLISLLGHPINPKATVASLSVGERQIVEIAKALRHKPSLLILDEPTAALGEAEARALGRLLRGLRDQGLAILYVTHFVNEVFEIADRVTVLRDGAVAVSGEVTSFTKRDIIAAIAPETMARTFGGDKRSEPGWELLLELTEFGDTKIGPIDLSVGKGEIVGVFGLLGSGRTELLEGIFGIRPDVTGQRSLGGKSFAPRTPCDFDRLWRCSGGRGQSASEHARPNVSAREHDASSFFQAGARRRPQSFAGAEGVQRDGTETRAKAPESFVSGTGVLRRQPAEDRNRALAHAEQFRPSPDAR